MREETATAGPIVSLRGVSKYYKLYASPKERLREALSLSGKKYHKKFYAIRDIDLEINQGEIVGIVGRNGSGKSTLLKLIAGVLTPDGGDIDVQGKVTALLELGGGFNPEFTGRKNIFFYGMILGFSRKMMAELLEDIIAFADIGEHIDQPLRTYSSGMRARLGFAVAIHVDPEILILDEVLAVGDALFQRKCHAKMEALFQSGSTIFYVSHNANSIKELCSRVIFIHEGNIIMDGDPKAVVNHYQKFLFATEAERAELEASLKNAVKISNKAPEPHPQRVTHSDATLLKTFRSKSAVESRQFGARAFDIAIETPQGREVNFLPFDAPFVFAYSVQFDEHEYARDEVYFGMQIRDIKGVNISGSNTQRQAKPCKVSNGISYRVRWTFRTNLLPGDYFASLSVFLIDNGQKRHLKIMDAYAFKVFYDGIPPFAGKTYLSQTFSMQALTQDEGVCR